MWWLGIIYLIKPLLFSSIYMTNIVFYRAYNNKLLLCSIVSSLGQESTNEVFIFPILDLTYLSFNLYRLREEQVPLKTKQGFMFMT